MISTVEQCDALSHLRENASHAWAVAGERVLPDGTGEMLVASAWGATEERARAFYERLQDLRECQALPGGQRGPRWKAEELTFLRVEEHL